MAINLSFFPALSHSPPTTASTHWRKEAYFVLLLLLLNTMTWHTHTNPSWRSNERVYTNMHKFFKIFFNNLGWTARIKQRRWFRGRWRGGPDPIRGRLWKGRAPTARGCSRHCCQTPESGARKAARVYLLWQAVPNALKIAAPRPRSHRRKAVQLPNLSEGLHPVFPPEKSSQVFPLRGPLNDRPRILSSVHVHVGLWWIRRSAADHCGSSVTAARK